MIRFSLACRDGLAFTIRSRLVFDPEPRNLAAILERLSPGCATYSWAAPAADLPASAETSCSPCASATLASSVSVAAGGLDTDVTTGGVSFVAAAPASSGL